MDWFYTQMVQMHAILGWCVLGLFLARGLGAQLGMQWPFDARLRPLIFGAHFLLAISGLSLWNLLGYDPRYHPWLAAKLIALAAYYAIGHWALTPNRFSLPAYLAALLLLAYVMGVSITRQLLIVA
jgi:uncharacterized membrane protein SirB2